MAHRDFPVGCGTHPPVQEKGKGIMVEADEDRCLGDDEDEAEDVNPVPENFEFGSGSGAGGASEPRDFPSQHPQMDTAPQAINVSNPAVAVEVDAIVEEAAVDVNEGDEWVEEDDGLVDWAEDDTGLSDWAEDDTLAKNHEEHLEIQCTQGGDSIPSDWENLADEEAENEKEITDEDLRLMQELEQEMILDGLLDNDDLLGEEMLAGETEGLIDDEDSQERTISECVVPISHPRKEIPATSQSPSSKRVRSPSRERRTTRRSSRIARSGNDGPESALAGPIGGNEATNTSNIEIKKASIPQSPKLFTNASRKLKLFGPKVSPKKKSAPPVVGPLGAGSSRSDNGIPHQEAEPINNNEDKKKEVKAMKPKLGAEESRISPEPPT
ncbi:unnamed protein product [Arabidopsis halleri]